MDRERLKRDVERIENIEVNRKALGGDVRDIYKGLQGVGFNPKAVRKIVQARRMTAADRAELENDIDAYRVALGMAVEMVSNGDVSLRQASAITGVSKSSIHRALPVPEVSQPMHADDLGSFEVGIPTAVREMVADDLGDPLWVVDRDRAKFREKIKEITSKLKPGGDFDASRDCMRITPGVAQEVEAGDPRGKAHPDSDDPGPIPDFLRRTA